MVNFHRLAELDLGDVVLAQPQVHGWQRYHGSISLSAGVAPLATLPGTMLICVTMPANGALSVALSR